MTERSDDDWLAIKADGSQFYAATGPQNLSDALDAFQAFVENDLR